MSKNPNKLFKNLGPTRSDNVLRPQVPSLSTRQTDQKTIGPLPQQGPLKPRLNNYLERWKEITSDPEIIHVVSGYQIPFHSVPVQLHVPVTKCSDLTVPLVDAEVSKLLSVGAIKAVPFSKENFFSRLFLVPKKEGTYSPVIDLSRLNTFVENFHFQMENISCLKTLLRRGDFMTCIDLKDAYLSVHVHRSSQKYLCFQKLQTPAEGSCVPSENPSNVPQASFSRLSVIREQHQTEGFSEDITKILQSATRASTHKTYQSAWGLWHSWCAKRKVNPISATLNDVLLFLTDRFNTGAAYRSVNVTHSAISSCHPKIDGYPVGQHPLVLQLLKGMLNMRPPKPRYTHTWDVHLVTKYLDCLGKTKLLPLKLLSIKLAMLFALSCPERASSLAKLDLRHCRVTPEGVSFTLVSPRKRGSPDQLPRAFFASFPHNERLCPVGTLRHYLNKQQQQHTFIRLVHTLTLIKLKKKINNFSVSTQLSLELK